MEKTTKPNNTNDQAKKIPEEIVQQIMQVRDTGKTNMFDLMGVLVVADELGLLNLQKYLFFRSNRETYIYYLLNGKLSNSKEANQLQD